MMACVRASVSDSFFRCHFFGHGQIEPRLQWTRRFLVVQHCALDVLGEAYLDVFDVAVGLVGRVGVARVGAAGRGVATDSPLL